MDGGEGRCDAHGGRVLERQIVGGPRRVARDDESHGDVAEHVGALALDRHDLAAELELVLDDGEVGAGCSTIGGGGGASASLELRCASHASTARRRSSSRALLTGSRARTP
jgi:hypothetical protein